jgi:hypothetical protein
MNSRTIAGLTVAVVLAGGALATTVVRADTPSPSPSASTKPAKPAGGSGTEQQEPKITGSITVPQTTGPEGTEADEAAALAKLAKITSAQAEQAALAKFPGATIQKISLDDENGSLVYSVELTDASKAAQEVKVDAGNGTVLAVEAGGADNERAGKAGDKD